MGAKNKRTDLSAIALTETSAPPTENEAQSSTKTEVEKGSDDKGPRTRSGIKQHTAYLPMPVHEQLRTLAFNEKRKIHDYILEGLDRVFKDRGLKSIEELSKPS